LSKVAKDTHAAYGINSAPAARSMRQKRQALARIAASSAAITASAGPMRRAPKKTNDQEIFA